MVNTFNWSIQKLRVVPQQDSKTNIVTQADWICVAVDDKNIVQSAVLGVKSFSLGDGFTPYDELKEEQVLGWCFAPETITKTDQDGEVTTVIKHLKADTEAQLSEWSQKQFEPPLPWAKIPA
jgi:hypothetical protein